MDSARLHAELESLSDDLQISNDEESKQKLRELLQCPICLEIPLPPIYLCKRGHIVCNACQDRTYYCPLCRDEYSNTRSFVAEGLIDNFTMKCRFRGQGCKEVMKGSAMVGHIKTCEYRPARCIYCRGLSHQQDLIPYGSFFEHLSTKHKIYGTSNKADGSVKFNIPMLQIVEVATAVEKFCWAPISFQCYGHTFLFQLYVTGGNVCTWICLIGTDAHCKKYEALIEFQGEKFKIQWKGEVNNFREDPLNTICKLGTGLILPFPIVRSNATMNGVESVMEWSYNVKIMEKVVEPVPADGAVAIREEIETELQVVEDIEEESDSNSRTSRLSLRLQAEIIEGLRRCTQSSSTYPWMYPLGRPTPNPAPPPPCTPEGERDPVGLHLTEAEVTSEDDEEEPDLREDEQTPRLLYQLRQSTQATAASRSRSHLSLFSPSHRQYPSDAPADDSSEQQYEQHYETMRRQFYDALDMGEF